MVISAGKALAAAPVIDRIWAWNVHSTRAGVSVSFNGDNQNCRVWFDISNSASMSKPYKLDLGTSSCSKATAAHADMSDLTPDTVYYFRAYVKNYDGEKYSGVGNFRTETAATKKPPSIRWVSTDRTTDSINMSFTCDGNGMAGRCNALWSTSPGMSGATEIKSAFVSNSGFYVPFNVSKIPDKTKIYIQGEMTTEVGKAKTAVQEFLIRNGELR
jgi:hypothetical protein